MHWVIDISTAYSDQRFSSIRSVRPWYEHGLSYTFGCIRMRIIPNSLVCQNLFCHVYRVFIYSPEEVRGI